MKKKKKEFLFEVARSVDVKKATIKKLKLSEDSDIKVPVLEVYKKKFRFFDPLINLKQRFKIQLKNQ
jgi:hypothetical protein